MILGGLLEMADSETVFQGKKDTRVFVLFVFLMINGVELRIQLGASYYAGLRRRAIADVCVNAQMCHQRSRVKAAAAELLPCCPQLCCSGVFLTNSVCEFDMNI